MKLPGQEIAIKQKIPHQGWHRCSSQLFTLQKRTQRLSAKWPFHLCPGHWPPHSSRRCHTFNWSVAYLPLSSRTKCLPQIRADSCRWEDHKKNVHLFWFSSLSQGWGRTETERNPSELRFTKLTQVPASVCEREWSKELRKNPNPLLRSGMKILGSQFCAGDVNRLSDACLGDSGGPIMVELDNRWLC